MKPIAAIFDLDGVIVDTAQFHFQAWKKIAATLRHELTHSQNEQLKG
ncbi:MAG: HAD hydrolase-like protein, partial [Flavobacteriaceae bacterium]